MRRLLAALVLSAAALPSIAGEPDPPLVRNASFEEFENAVPVGWEVSEGASTGGAKQLSEVFQDREFFRQGASALRLSGGGGTTSWRLLRQKVTAAPGQRITLRVAAKSAGVRKEGNQYPNANALLEFVDAKGERVNLGWTRGLQGTEDWSDLHVTTLVPAGTAAVWVGVFLSQSGTLWFDDVRLSLAPGDAATAEGRAAAFDAVEAHLRATYPFFGYGKKPEADAFFAKRRGACVDAAADADAFARALRTALGELEDLHVWIRNGDATVPTTLGSAVRPNVDARVRRALLGEVLDEAKPLLAGRIRTEKGDVGYLAIDSWRMDAAAAARLEADLDALKDCRALVIDVRANAGGDETLAQKVASRFAAEDVVYARSLVRDPRSSATTVFLPPQDRVLPRRQGAAPDARPVAVLQGRWCMSSCEGFLLMARALPTVTTVGDRSRGASGNPRPFDVVPGFVLWSSTWRTLPPGGSGSPDETIEGKGVEPEVVVEDVPKDGADPVLARALELLRR